MAASHLACLLFCEVNPMQVKRLATVSLSCAVVRAVRIVRGENADYPIRPVAAHHVQFNDGFWWPRLEVNRITTIPYSFQSCEETGRIENFKVAAGTSDKKWTGRFGFNDSDVSKIMEGAAYSLHDASGRAAAEVCRRTGRRHGGGAGRRRLPVHRLDGPRQDRQSSEYHLLLSEGNRSGSKRR